MFASIYDLILQMDFFGLIVFAGRRSLIGKNPAIYQKLNNTKALA